MNIRSIGWDSVYSSTYRFCTEARNGVYLLVLFRSRCVVGGSHYPSGTMILYDGTEGADFAADGSFLAADWLTFDTAGDAESLDPAGFLMNTPFRCTDPGFASGLIQSLNSCFYTLGSRRIKRLDVLLKTLLMRVQDDCTGRESTQQTADPHYTALVELREKIYRNPQLKWNVDTMAAAVNMSRSYFQHIYRELFGVSCMTDVISGKLEKAKEILSETDCTVSQVAAMCGYDNDEHFMRQFKKVVGVTPTAYRKRSI